MLKQTKPQKFLTFLILVAFFVVGYFYSNFRNMPKPSTTALKTVVPTTESLPESDNARPLFESSAPVVSLTLTPLNLKQQKYDRLKKLSTDVQISYFSGLLGKPVYINYFDSNIHGYEFLEDEIREYVFVDTDYYVQAITDKHDKVMSFAVTSRKDDFNPLLPWGNAVKVVLNKTPFSEWMPNQERPLACYRYTSAHTLFLYFEEAYFGNPGHYLTYLVGINSSPPYPIGIPSGDNGNYGGNTDCKTVDRESRARLSPNTYIVRGLSFPINISNIMSAGEDFEPGIFFGPDPVQVRTLNE